MEEELEKTDRTTGLLCWTARTIGVIVALFWIIMIIAAAIAESSSLTFEGFFIAVMVIGNSAGVILSWTNERKGGLITLLFGISFCIFALISAGRNHLLAMLVSGGPFVLVGVLFLIVSRRTQAATESGEGE
jgi:hypothetical protein